MSAIRIRLSLLVFAVSLQAQTDAVVELTTRAVQLQQAGQYEEAAQAYRSLLKARPNEVAGHVNLGIVLVNLGKFDEALNEYKTALALDPGDPRIELNEALAYQKAGRIDEAAKRFSSLHSASPDDRKITQLLADCYLQSGQDDKVIALLGDLAKSDTGDLGIAYMYGTALMREQRVAEAQTYLDRILGHGDSAEGHYLLGTRMFESHDYPAAVKELAAAVERNPKLPEVQSYYGRALLNTGDPDAAAAAFRAQLAQNRNDFAANLSLGQILSFRKQYTEALPVLEQAAGLRPQSAEVQLTLGQTLNGLGKTQQARRQLEMATHAMPDSLEAHSSLLAVYEQSHLTAQAAAERTSVERIRRMANAAEPGPKVESAAPDFTLRDANTGRPIALSDIRRGNGTVLVFGSYSCPNFRGSAEELKSLYARYGTHVPFLLVYIKEAHSTADWQSTRNQREAIELTPASSLTEKQQHAVLCSRKLHLPFNAVVDGMDGAVESAYAAWPSRVYAISREGNILYSSRLTELDFQAEELERVIKQMISVSKGTVHE